VVVVVAQYFHVLGGVIAIGFYVSLYIAPVAIVTFVVAAFVNTVARHFLPPRRVAVLWLAVALGTVGGLLFLAPQPDDRTVWLVVLSCVSVAGTLVGVALALRGVATWSYPTLATVLLVIFLFLGGATAIDRLTVVQDGPVRSVIIPIGFLGWAWLVAAAAWLIRNGGRVPQSAAISEDAETLD
jgi:hypothetical protein